MVNPPNVNFVIPIKLPNLQAKHEVADSHLNIYEYFFSKFRRILTIFEQVHVRFSTSSFKMFSRVLALFVSFRSFFYVLSFFVHSTE